MVTSTNTSVSSTKFFEVKARADFQEYAWIFFASVVDQEEKGCGCRHARVSIEKDKSVVCRRWPFASLPKKFDGQTVVDAAPFVVVTKGTHSVLMLSISSYVVRFY
jgi:hypothetical protein